MALNQSIQRKFKANQKEVRYLNKTFPEFRQSMIDFIKAYYPTTYSDFNEASPGMIFIELASYLGDVLSFYVDNQFKENFISYAQEEKNILTIAQSFGYKPRLSSAAVTNLEIYQIVPALSSTDNYAPDPNYLLTVLAGSTFRTSTVNSQTFRSTMDVDFRDPIERTLTVNTRDPITGVPQLWLAKKTVPVAAGEIKTLNYTFGSAQKFSKITLSDSNVISIIDVIDSDGNVWYEVDFLGQDMIFKEYDVIDNNEVGLAPPKTFTFTRTPRRFITRINRQFQYELMFGSGTDNVSEELVTLDSRQIANETYQQKIANTSLDPVDFLDSTTYGLAPSNTTLTIRYLVGGGLESNSNANTITVVENVFTKQNADDYATNTERNLFNTIVSNIAVNNPIPATGGAGKEGIEEIRQNSMAYFNAQNRVVTVQDYVVRTLSMNPKYGSISKAYAISLDQIGAISSISGTNRELGRAYVDDMAIPNAVNLYVLGYDNRKKISVLNSLVKENLARYLEQYRVLNDNVNILDAFVVNIGVNFEVKVYKNFNLNEVLLRCIDVIKEHFDIDKWQINQPIYLNELTLELASVDGVRAVHRLEIVNKYSFVDGSDYNAYNYPIEEALVDNIIYPSADPCIFELRYPERDIVGSASQ